MYLIEAQQLKPGDFLGYNRRTGEFTSEVYHIIVSISYNMSNSLMVYFKDGDSVPVYKTAVVYYRASQEIESHPDYIHYKEVYSKGDFVAYYRRIKEVNTYHAHKVEWMRDNKVVPTKEEFQASINKMRKEGEPLLIDESGMVCNGPYAGTYYGEFTR